MIAPIYQVCKAAILTKRPTMSKKGLMNYNRLTKKSSQNKATSSKGSQITIQTWTNPGRVTVMAMQTNLTRVTLNLLCSVSRKPKAWIKTQGFFQSTAMMQLLTLITLFLMMAKEKDKVLTSKMMTSRPDEILLRESRMDKPDHQMETTIRPQRKTVVMQVHERNPIIHLTPRQWTIIHSETKHSRS